MSMTTAERLWKLAKLQTEPDRVRLVDKAADELDSLQKQLAQRNETISGLQHETEMWEEAMSQFTENESDEAPWQTIEREFKHLQKQLAEAKAVLKRIAEYLVLVHSEPYGGALAMQDMAHNFLKGNAIEEDK